MTGWVEQRERGGAGLVAALAWLVLRAGWPLGRLLLWPATGWFLLTSPSARAASREYLGLALGRAPHFRDVALHFHSFAAAVLDRLFLVTGRVRGYHIRTEGLEHVAGGRGCVLLGAHLGSFEVLRLVAQAAPVPVWALMFRRNAGALTRLLDRLAPDLRDGILEVGDTTSMLRAHECVERGEIVGILADRAPPGHQGVAAPFFGKPAAFPAGPFVLASTLAAPVVLFQGLRLGPRRYLVRFEPFAERVVLRRASRAADLAGHVARYAAALERGCRAHPFNWFNFYPFWSAAAEPGHGVGRRLLPLLLLLARPALAAEPEPLDLPALMARLAAVPERRATFREVRRFAALSTPLESTGRLLYRRPKLLESGRLEGGRLESGRLEKLTDWPERESLVVEGDRLVLMGADAPRVVDLAGQPELRSLVDAMRGPLAGDLAALRRAFLVTGAGTAAAWSLALVPRDPRAARLLRSVQVDGAGDEVTAIRLVQANGDEQTMRITPAPSPGGRGSRRRRASLTRTMPVLGALAASVLLLLLVLRFVTIRTDMAEFLPAGQTEAARLVMQEARTGTATGLVLMGLDGAPPPELARISQAMAATLRGTGLFSLVAGGQDGLDPAMGESLFARRYLLAPADFGTDALRAGMEGLLRQLRSSGAPLAVHYGLADPPGAFPALLRRWIGGSTVRVVDGAWFERGRDRALLLARTRAGGMDVPAQEAATAAIDRAFQAAGPGAARLVVTGPAVFARDAARAIRGDVRRIAVVSTVLVAGLLWWRFRSPLVVAAIAMPVVLSVAAAAAAVQAGFGAVHGVALGFGTTMLGVSVDYPVLMIGHRKRNEPAGRTRARIGRAFVLAVATAVLGLGAMVFSGFPGLLQLGVFSAVGLASAALATWVLLPRLVVAANLAPASDAVPGWLARVEGLRRGRWWAAAPVLAAAAGLLAAGGPRWEGDLANLSPVPAEARALDAELRGALGAPDAGQILLVRGRDAEAVLRRQEALQPLLDRLQGEDMLAGAEYAARLLPSAAAQTARIAALPDPAALAARVEQARAGLPFRAEAFTPFLDAVAASRALAPLTPADLAGTPVAARLDPLLAARDSGWVGAVVLSGVRDPARLAREFAGREGTTYVDVRAELGGILSGYTARAWTLLGWSALAILAVLAAGLRDAGRVLRVLAAVGAALLVAVAALSAAGVRLSLLHLVALQLVAGVGLDYALFFARPLLDAEERARTLRTLLTCNGMTLLTFGLLATCQTPILHDIGITVAAGAVLAMAFAFLVAGQPPPRGPCPLPCS